MFIIVRPVVQNPSLLNLQCYKTENRLKRLIDIKTVGG